MRETRCHLTACAQCVSHRQKPDMKTVNCYQINTENNTQTVIRAYITASGQAARSELAVSLDQLCMVDLTEPVSSHRVTAPAAEALYQAT